MIGFQMFCPMLCPKSKLTFASMLNIIYRRTAYAKDMFLLTELEEEINEGYIQLECAIYYLQTVFGDFRTRIYVTAVMQTGSAAYHTINLCLYYFLEDHSTMPSEMSDSGKKYRNSCTGDALDTVKRHETPQDITFFGACFCPFVQRVWAALEYLEVPYLVS